MFDLKQMSDLIKSIPSIPVGFIVSKQTWDELRERIPMTFGEDHTGAQIAVDHTMPPEKFEIVWNRDAWRRRIDEIHASNLGRMRD
jgi:hypothetical protein